MSAKENFKIVSIKELTAIARALSDAKNAVEEAHEVLRALVGEASKPAPVKTPRTRRTKAEMEAAAQGATAAAVEAPVKQAEKKKPAEAESNAFLQNLKASTQTAQAAPKAKPNGALPAMPRLA